ncbi:hypothetical protein FQV39_26295 [Bosea sp. F3-2]|uniref:hypothetical protein n=1 Tax=Bosea sp. F3-2 TaxID=2599640 RepID=UPI0011EF4CAE|nr:hypothetical protein [Bosea sp. F3-2]QEL25719.1 hypothetical protein FQV39_26295 [Bosea sp. F3-2]
MQAGGFTETIWQFIGYLRLSDSVARTSGFYDGETPPPLPPAVDDLLREPRHGLDFDELVSVPTTIREPPTADSHVSFAPVSMPDPHGLPNKELPALRLPPSKPQPPDPYDMSLAHHSGPRVITVEYQAGGDEALLQLRQINVADDRDLVTSNAVTHADGSPVIPPELHLEKQFEALVDQANDIAPDGIPTMNEALRAGPSEIIAMVSTRDALWTQTGSPYPEGSTVPAAPEGRIVDGVVGAPDPHVPTVLDSAPWRPEDPPVQTVTEAKLDVAAPTGGVATLAETGLNKQINAAAIVDTNEAVGSMMVGGDYFYSRGIVQLNILVDNDHVDVAVAGALTPAIETHGNDAHNIAEFVTHHATIDVKGAAATPHWSVDVISGEFYDIKSIVQFNSLDDNDRTVQAEAGTYFNLHTGENEQLNLAKIRGIADYDVIVIDGNYHRADWIYQYNILLDPDYAKLYSTGNADDDTTVTSGFNSLTNKASIETYDAAFKPMLDAHHELVDQFAAGATILTPNADWHLYGDASGTLKILYVAGDYYDANVITQVNFMVDGDQSIQASAKEGTEQGVAAGGNSALNEAFIVDPGLMSTSNYLSGQAYEESVLIQVNIVTDSDTVKVHDTSTLVPELVAFAEHAAPEPEPHCRHAPPPDPAQHDHVTSNIMV